MAKKPPATVAAATAAAPPTNCELGGPEKLPDQITVTSGETITFESWICKGAGEVRLWIDPPPQMGNPTAVFHKQSTGPQVLELGPGTHQLIWLMLSPSSGWQWRSEIATTNAAGTKTVRALHRMTAAGTIPPALAFLEVIVQ